MGTDATSSGRLYWVDFAKAVAIILVVVYHVGGDGVGFLFPTMDGPASPFWSAFNEIFLPMRMPLFFATAGMLAHAAINRSWDAVWRPRILTLVWPYVLWSVAFALFAGFAYTPDNPAFYTVNRLIALPLLATGYWFLPVLVVFFVTAKLLRRWASTVLIVSLVVAALIPIVEAFTGQSLVTYAAIRIARYAFWYFLGCYAFDRLNGLSQRNPLPMIVGGGVLFAGLTWLANVLDLSTQFGFVLSIVGLTAAAGVSIWIVRFSVIRSASRYVAARTLPIYLIHPVLINLLVLGVMLSGAPMGPNETWATLLTPVLSVACIVVAIVAYDRIVKTRAAWLFNPPVFLDRTSPRVK